MPPQHLVTYYCPKEDGQLNRTPAQFRENILRSVIMLENLNDKKIKI